MKTVTERSLSGQANFMKFMFVCTVALSLFSGNADAYTGWLIDQPGIYNMEYDFNGRIIISAPNVTLNMHGYDLLGPGYDCGIQIMSSASNVTINGDGAMITNFNVGIYCDPVNYYTINHVVCWRCITYGVYGGHGPKITMQDVQICQTNYDAYTGAYIGNLIIDHAYFCSNRRDGINVTNPSTAQITNSILQANSLDGVSLDVGWDVTYTNNDASYNGESGLCLFDRHRKGTYTSSSSDLNGCHGVFVSSAAYPISFKNFIGYMNNYYDLEDINYQKLNTYTSCGFTKIKNW